MPRKLKVGPSSAALCGVVIDHIQDHLDARRVQALHHDLEFFDLAAGAVAHLRSQKAYGVVAPIVAQPLLHEAPIIQEGRAPASALPP